MPVPGKPRILVREARRGELAAAGEVVAGAYQTLGGPHHDWYLAQIRDAAGRAATCPILVALDEAGTIVGSVTYVPGPDNPFAELERENEGGFRMLGVAPAARGHGVGRALVEACIQRARKDGRRALAISSRPHMHSARHLYGRLGFRRVPERDFDAAPGIDLLAYVLDL
jgi:ribosomal protein S18 acetylase RimI-like enzyme